MLDVFFNWQGIMPYELISKSAMVNKERYKEVLVHP
jgi:hypothetical protein